MLKIDQPRIRVDFNEFLEPDLVLLSQSDICKNSEGGGEINLSNGLLVSLYEYNHYKYGTEEYLYAEGIVVPNTVQASPAAKWCCKINSKGITVVNT